MPDYCCCEPGCNTGYKKVAKTKVQIRLLGQRHRRLRDLHHSPRPAHLDDLHPIQQEEKHLAREDLERGPTCF